MFYFGRVVEGFRRYFIGLYQAQDYSFLQAKYPWDYGRRGPEAWPYLFPECDRSMQSPIDIPTQQTLYNPRLRPFRFINYDAQVAWNVSNTENASEFNWFI